MLRKLTGKNQTHRRLDFARRDGGFFGVGGELCVTQYIDKTRINQRQKRHILDASVAIRSKISFTNEFKMAMALFEIPVSG